MLRGTIVSVSTRSAAGELDGDHASGSTELTVADVFDFNAGGGSLSIGAETYTYTSTDDDTNTIALSGATTADYDDGDKVTILPARVEKVATVVLDGTDAAIPARIMHVLAPFLPEGVRAAGDQEYAVLLSDGQEYLVIDAPGQVPAMDPTAIAPPASEAIYINGPPDFYARDDFLDAGQGALLTYAEMAAVADPAWVAMLDGIEFDNGTIVLPGANLDPFWKYLPVWFVPNEGRQFRVVLDEVTFGGSAGTLEEDDVQIFVTMQEDDGSVADAARVDYWESSTWDDYAVNVRPQQWHDYVTLYPDSDYEGDDYSIQRPPLQSLTPAEALDPLSPEQLSLPQVAVCLFDPFTNYAFDTTGHIITITGLRVELL